MGVTLLVVFVPCALIRREVVRLRVDNVEVFQKSVDNNDTVIPKVSITFQLFGDALHTESSLRIHN